MTKISIIVAVFNGEKYLQKCLDSLYCQTYKDIEIICINDASTDNSANIIKAQMQKDNRIKLLEHSVNKGPAKAWNSAIRIASGEVIGYLDCDDWYDEDTIEKLMAVFNSHEDADCVLYRCIQVDSKGNRKDYSGRLFNSLDGKEAFLESLHWGIHGVYAARAELFKQFPIDETRRHFSCDNTTRIHYYKSRKVYQSSAPYYYLSNPDSISNQISISRMDYLAATQSMKSQLIKLRVDEYILRKYEFERVKVLVDCYLFYYKHRKEWSREQREYCLTELKEDWKSIDSSLLSTRQLLKFGFCPCSFSWNLFRLQEEIYFMLKDFVGKL